MQAKRRRISMANMSTQPRPEERSLRRSVSKDAPASASGAANESFPSTCSGPAFETPCFRAAPQNEVCGWTAECVWARDGAHASAVRLERRRDRLRRKLRLCRSFASILSPEAPPSFGDLADASPLVAVFTAARGARDPALDVGLFAEPKFDLASALTARRARALWRHLRPSRSKGLPRRTSRRRSSTTRPSGLRSRRCKARSKRRCGGSSRVTIAATLSAQATGAPLAARSQPSTPGAPYAPVWVSETGLTDVGRAALGATQARPRRRPQSVRFRSTPRSGVRP